MYNLPEYKELDPEVVKKFMREHPFVFLIATGNDMQPVATQVPVFIDERDGELFLTGHIMKQTDHHKAVLQNPKVLAVFTSEHTYVSASWYENKRQGSTWNYISVHAKGTIRFFEGDELREVLRRTQDYFENDPHSGSNYKDLPEEYIARNAKAIVGFEIKVDKLEHVFKLSQNRDDKSYQNIIQKLEEKGNAPEIVNEMKKRR